MPRFKVVIVFPSPGDGLVNNITLGDLSGREKSNVVLIAL
jgi:hypothetical protein